MQILDRYLCFYLLLSYVRISRCRLVRASIETRTFKILFNDKWRLIGYRSRKVSKDRDVYTLSYRRGNPRLMGLLSEKENVIRAACNTPFSEIQTKADRARRIVPQRSGYLPISSWGIEEDVGGQFIVDNWCQPNVEKIKSRYASRCSKKKKKNVTRIYISVTYFEQVIYFENPLFYFKDWI